MSGSCYAITSLQLDDTILHAHAQLFAHTTAIRVHSNKRTSSVIRSLYWQWREIVVQLSLVASRGTAFPSFGNFSAWAAATDAALAFSRFSAKSRTRPTVISINTNSIRLIGITEKKEFSSLCELSICLSAVPRAKSRGHAINVCKIKISGESDTAKESVIQSWVYENWRLESWTPPLIPPPPHINPRAIEQCGRVTVFDPPRRWFRGDSLIDGWQRSAFVSRAISRWTKKKQTSYTSSLLLLKLSPSSLRTSLRLLLFLFPRRWRCVRTPSFELGADADFFQTKHK